jgi:hypothetical protein
MDLETHRTKGYGFVSFVTHERAARNIPRDGEIFKGRRIRVGWAVTNKEPRPRVSDTPPPPLPPPALDVSVVQETRRILGARALIENLDVFFFQSLGPPVQRSVLDLSNHRPGAKEILIQSINGPGRPRSDFPTDYVYTVVIPAIYRFVPVVTKDISERRGFCILTCSHHLSAALAIATLQGLCGKLSLSWNLNEILPPNPYLVAESTPVVRVPMQGYVTPPTIFPYPATPYIAPYPKQSTAFVRPTLTFVQQPPLFPQQTMLPVQGPMYVPPAPISEVPVQMAYSDRRPMIYPAPAPVRYDTTGYYNHIPPAMHAPFDPYFTTHAYVGPAPQS